MIIEAIEEGELLRAVGLVFGDIEVDRDQASAPSPAAMAGQHPVGSASLMARSIRGAAVAATLSSAASAAAL